MPNSNFDAIVARKAVSVAANSGFPLEASEIRNIVQRTYKGANISQVRSALNKAVTKKQLKREKVGNKIVYKPDLSYVPAPPD